MGEHTDISIHELIQKSLDGDLSLSESSILNDFVSRSENIEYYLKCLRLSYALKNKAYFFELSESISGNVFALGLKELAIYEQTAPAVEVPKQKPSQELIQKVVYKKVPAKTNKAKLLTALLSAAALIFLFVYARYALMRETTSVKVATLVDQMDVKWTDSKTNLQSGSYLWTNDPPLCLEKGVIKIQYDQGVEALIEGPAVFEIERSGIFLKYGRLYSRVSKTGLGFSVDTPTCRFIDLGTEFGVKSDIDGSSELHVLTGKVQLFAGSKGDSKTSQIISESKATRFNVNDDQIETIPFESTAFVRQADSKTGIMWRGQMRINLADIVGGGNGFGSGAIGSAIDPLTGEFVGVSRREGRDSNGRYVVIHSKPIIDGVFVPNGKNGPVQISSTQLTFDGFRETCGRFWQELGNGGKQSYGNIPETVDITLEGIPYGTEQMPALFMHSNLGITFDLQQVHRIFPGCRVSEFTVLCGIPDNSGSGYYSLVDFLVLVDGRCVFRRDQVRNDSQPIPVKVEIGPQDRFLTLVVTDGGNDHFEDAAVYALPYLELTNE